MGLEAFLRSLADLPPFLLYVCIGLGAAIENFIPPVPADTFVLFGAFLAAAGRASPWVVFLVTWSCNVAAAMLVYYLARKYGKAFFRSKFGAMLLNEHQLDRIDTFYDRWGIPAIAFSRFLPAFRAMVPVFGGVSKVPVLKLGLPLALASGVWYGLLVYLGTKAGENFDAVLGTFEKYNRILLIVAAVLLAAFAVWWIKSRKEKVRE
jgi:membrane protein DedA with SNARE-associated domain